MSNDPDGGRGAGRRRLATIVVGLLLACAPGCARERSVQPPRARGAPNEEALLYAEALRTCLTAVIGDRDLNDCVVVVEAGAESEQVATLMYHPSFTTLMPSRIDARPVGSIDLESGRTVLRITLSVAEISDQAAVVAAIHDCGTRCGGAHHITLVPLTNGWHATSIEELWKN